MTSEPRSELFTGWGYIPEKVKKAHKKIEIHRYDTDAWSILLREAQSQPVDKARPLYELLISTFSNSGRYWKMYIEQEVISQRISSGRAFQAGFKWREDQGESRTGNEYGPLVDLPDWAYADGRPAPLGPGHLRRQEQQRDIAKRIDRLAAEMNAAVQKEKDAANLAEDRQREIDKQKLKRKGQFVNESIKDSTHQNSH